MNTAENANVYRATLERARIERELKVAADIQRALLPELARKASGFEVAAASAPCRAIGGDFFDYYDQPTGAFGFCLGDVAGKGPAAALLAAECQGILGLAQSNLAGNAGRCYRQPESRAHAPRGGRAICNGRVWAVEP